MSGKIKLGIRMGKSKDIKYNYYPEWIMKVVDENNKETILSPKYDELQDFIVDVLVHELIIDESRLRNKEFYKKMSLFNINILEEKVKHKIIKLEKINSIYLYGTKNEKEVLDKIKRKFQEPNQITF